MSDLALMSHFAAGGITLVLFWCGAITRKGSHAHRRYGRLFFLSLIPVAVSVWVVLFARASTFDPTTMIQFIYLLICLATVGTVGWTAIRWKEDLALFRGTHFKILAPLLFLSGVSVLIAGLIAQQPLAIILSSIGIVFGGTMLRFVSRPLVHPKWWLGWHLNAVLLLSSAVHGTLLAVIYRELVDPSGFEAAQLVTQPGTLLLALALRIYIGNRRGIPISLSTPRVATESK